MSGAWRPLVVGYAVQLTNMFVLFLYHFLLPLVLDTEPFAQLVVVTATGGLIVLLFDAGFNLMTIRRPRFAAAYLGYKLCLVAVCAIVALLLLASEGGSPWEIAASIAYAVSFTVYTHGTSLLVALGHYVRSAYVTCVYGLLLTAVPIGFQWLGIPLVIAPLLSTLGGILCLGMVIPGWHDQLLGARRSAFDVPSRLRHVARAFVRQLQLSAGPFIEGMTTSGAILYCALQYSSEAVASARVAFSMAAVLGMTLPFNRQFVFAAFSSDKGLGRIARLAGLLVLAALAQAAIMHFAHGHGLLHLYPPAQRAFDAYPWILLVLPGLRVLFELSIVAADSLKSIDRVTVVYAVVPATLALLLFSREIEWFALATYSLALAACLILALRGSRIRH